jgi:hypothetical protein
MEKLLIVEHDPEELERLSKLVGRVITRLNKTDVIKCVEADNLESSMAIIQSGINFLITNMDLGLGVIDWTQTGVIVARSAWQKNVPRHKICIYASEFPEWTPQMAAVNKIPLHKLAVPFLEFFIPESSIRAN